jgi:hypothetical protein
LVNQYKNGAKVSGYLYAKTEPVDYLFHSTVPTNNAGAEYELWLTFQWRFALPGVSGTATLNVYFHYTATTDSCPHIVQLARTPGVQPDC